MLEIAVVSIMRRPNFHNEEAAVAFFKMVIPIDASARVKIDYFGLTAKNATTDDVIHIGLKPRQWVSDWQIKTRYDAHSSKG